MALTVPAIFHAKRYIPPALAESRDNYRRARLIVNMAFVCAATCPVVALSYVGHHHYLAVGIVLVAALLFTAVPIVMRSSASFTVSGNMLCSISFVMFHSLVFTTGGLQSSVLQWTTLVPLLAALMMGRRQMIGWAAAVVIVALVYFVATAVGYQFENRIPAHGMMRSEMVALTALAIVVALLAHLFEVGREQMFNAIEKSNQEAQELNKGLLAMKSELEKEKSKVERMMRESEDMRDYLAENMEHMLEAVHRFAHGDLTVRFDVQSQDYIGQLFRSFNNAMDNMLNLTVQVIENVQSTASASAEISANTASISDGSIDQATRIATSAFVIDHIASQMKKSAQVAIAFAKKSKDAATRSQESSGVINETIEGMNRIEQVVMKSASTVEQLGKSGEQIGAIVQTIEEIADQTNLLALNAAIEAARAGEQGRGFAVVADEVRKLAERTTKATKEISDMIKRIQNDTTEAVGVIHRGTDEVARGKQLVMMTGLVLEEMIKGTAESADTYSIIAKDNEQQAKEVDELAHNIESINRVVQEEAIGMQQIAEATVDLSKLTERLLQLVGTFKIDNRIMVQIAKAPQENYVRPVTLTALKG